MASFANTYDVFVAGLGALGGATARALARAGLRVAGCDALHPPHDRGSSHGESRIIRAAYFEDPIYAPLAQRAGALWRTLEAETGQQLLRVTGGVNIGPRGGMLVAGALASARQYDVAHELLERGELLRRFPGFAVAADHVALYEPDAAVLAPEACVRAQLSSAHAAGAVLLFDEPLQSWRRAADIFEIGTTRAVYRARNLILAVGPWLSRLQPLPLQVTRQPVFWFAPVQPELYRAERLPHYLIEFERGRVFYGFPDLGNGVKCAIHHEGEPTTADAVDRSDRPVDLAQVRELIACFLPHAAGPLLRSSVCLYTNTPDFHFIVDRTATDGLWLLSACSGHGFKFAPAIAELLAAAIVAGAELPTVFSARRAAVRDLVAGARTE